MWEDPIVAEVRRVREGLSGQFNFDVRAIFADLRKRQTALGPRLVRRQSPTKTEEAGQGTGNPTALRRGR
jgi:hypothetical protein